MSAALQRYGHRIHSVVMRRFVTRAQRVVACCLLVFVMDVAPTTLHADTIGAASNAQVPALVLSKLKGRLDAPSAAMSGVDDRLRAVVSKLGDLGVTPRNARGLGLRSLSNPLVRVDDGGAIQVYVHVAQFGAFEATSLEDNGVAIEIINEDLGIVQGWVYYARLEDIALLPFVTRIGRPGYGVNWGHSATTEGDAIIGADELRDLAIDGSGVKVGVISDGVNSLATAQAAVRRAHPETLSYQI